jgi:hypothetical protein
MATMSRLCSAPAHHRGIATSIWRLAPVYGWFTEGFNTLDLEEAKVLLDEQQA